MFVRNKAHLTRQIKGFPNLMDLSDTSIWYRACRQSREFETSLNKRWKVCVGEPSVFHCQVKPIRLVMAWQTWSLEVVLVWETTLAMSQHTSWQVCCYGNKHAHLFSRSSTCNHVSCTCLPFPCASLWCSDQQLGTSRRPCDDKNRRREHNNTLLSLEAMQSECGRRVQYTIVCVQPTLIGDTFLTTTITLKVMYGIIEDFNYILDCSVFYFPFSTLSLPVTFGALRIKPGYLAHLCLCWLIWRAVTLITKLALTWAELFIYCFQEKLMA